MIVNRRSGLAAILAVLLAFSPSLILAQESPPEGKQLEELWEDLLHYIRVARADLGQSYGQAILESGADPKELYLLSVKTPGWDSALGRGARLEGMGPVIAGIREMIERGHEGLRQDPKEIANSIDLLGGTVRGFELAARRLTESGEYALPQLIQKLRDPNTPMTLRERVIEVLPRLGKQAVRPLSVALQATEPGLLEAITGALARIEYPHAAGRLKELTERKEILPRTKKAAEIALVACAGPEALNKTVSALYYDQAISYYYQRESVAPDKRYPTANVWYWTSAGLTHKVVPREIFCDVYAMRMCRLALKHDKSFYPAISLWIAANLKRTADLPEGETDPTYGGETPPAEYFALASSAKYLQDVLARGLKDKNAPVAMGAIEALSQTAGAENLLEPVAGGAQPLVAALSYPDRQVRFLAGLSLANALPKKRFTGYQSVIPQLVEALRQISQRRALVIIADENQRNRINDSIRSVGYDVLDNPDPVQALTAAHGSSGIDVAVLGDRPDPVKVVSTLRGDPSFATLPVVIAAKTDAVRSLLQRDERAIQLESPPDADAITDALARAQELSGGPEMTPDDVLGWIIRSANAIEYLGLTGNKVFDITRSAGALGALLEDERDEVRLAASRALSVMNFAPAQRAIAAKTVDPDVPENIRILMFEDLSASLRRYGNLLNEELADAILGVVTGKGPTELLNAAAQALGAMDLPSERIQVLILQTGR